MKNGIHINQLGIILEGFNIKGATLDTWALFDYLGQWSINSKAFNKEGEGWIWLNSYLIKEQLPLCRFTKQKIKKHLDLLQKAGLIELKTNTEGYLLCRATASAELIIKPTIKTT